MAWPGIVSLSYGIRDRVIQKAISQLEDALRRLRQFDANNDGLVPASGGDPTKFLCADGTWKTP